MKSRRPHSSDKRTDLSAESITSFRKRDPAVETLLDRHEKALVLRGKSRADAKRSREQFAKELKEAPAPTDVERGLKSAILKDAKAHKAFENLVRNGYQADALIAHLTMWARAPGLLFQKTLRSKVPTRDAKRQLMSLLDTLLLAAKGIGADAFQRELLNELDHHWMITENGGSKAAERVTLLPDTLRLYAKVLRWQFLMDSRLFRDGKTYNEYRSEQTRIFFDLARKRTGKDRVDSVVPLFECASLHFCLDETFEEKALSQQLKRHRETFKALRERHAEAEKALYSRVATQLGITAEHVRSVALGQRRSNAILAAVLAALRGRRSGPLDS